MQDNARTLSLLVVIAKIIKTQDGAASLIYTVHCARESHAIKLRTAFHLGQKSKHAYLLNIHQMEASAPEMISQLVIIMCQVQAFWLRDLFVCNHLIAMKDSVSMVCAHLLVFAALPQRQLILERVNVQLYKPFQNKHVSLKIKKFI